MRGYDWGEHKNTSHRRSAHTTYTKYTTHANIEASIEKEGASGLYVHQRGTDSLIRPSLDFEAHTRRAQASHSTHNLGQIASTTGRLHVKSNGFWAITPPHDLRFNDWRGHSMAQNNKLLKNGLAVLGKAYRKAKGRSRNEEKHKGRAGEMIFSERSLEAHSSAWTQFAEWAGAQGVKSMKQITSELVEDYVRHMVKNGGRDGNGATKKTLKGYVGAVNKVMTASGQWEDQQRLSLKAMGVEVRADVGAGYKRMNASEWKQANQQQYERYRDTFDTAEAFGLRARELQELNASSIVKDDQSGRLYVQTIGKGGKFRLAECRADMQERMEELHAGHIRTLDTSKLTEANLVRNIRDESQRLNMKGADSHKLPKHIFRAEYAQRLLEQKLAEYPSNGQEWRSYNKLDRMGNKERWGEFRTTVCGRTGSAEVFLAVSRSLGHNRLDVLTAYLNA